MTDEGFTMTEEDLAPLWSEKTDIGPTLVVGLWILELILLACSPAVVIAFWRWAL